MNAKAYFDRAAETWDERFLTPSLFSFLERLVPQFGLEAGQKVLDVGTGTGVLIPYLARIVGTTGSVTAIDLSERMVQASRAKHSHIENVNITVGNIEEEDFPAGSFDAVICFGVFPHIDNKERALRNIGRVLKPGCRLIIAHALGSEELKAHHKKVAELGVHSVMPGKAEIRQLLASAGFVGTRIRDERGSYLCVAQKTGNAQRQC